MTAQQIRAKGRRESQLWTLGIAALMLLGLTITTSLSGLPDRANVVELAVYTIKEGQRALFLGARKEMLSSVSRYRGFVRANTYQSLNTPNLYVDCYVWASYEEALSAAKKIQSDERSQAFLQSIDSLKIYNHSKLIETAKRARVLVFDMLRKCSGFKFARTGKSVDRSLFVDFVVMSDRKTALEADKRITPTKEAESYFALVGQFHFFDRLRLSN